MRQAEIVAHLMSAGFEVPLAVVQPRSARAHKGHTGGSGHVWLAAGDHHLIGIVRVNVTRGHSRRARGIQYPAKFVVITGIVRQPQRRREFGALTLQCEGRLLIRHVSINGIHVRDKSLQSRIRRALSLKIWKIHADDEQGLLPLGFGAVGDHAIQIRSQGRGGTGLLGTFRKQQGRDGLSIIGIASDQAVAKSDHWPVGSVGLLLR